MLTEKRGLAIEKRIQKLQAKLDDARRRCVERGIGLAVKARAIAGPHGVIVDADTLEPLRAATEAEVAASAAAANETDPDGLITIEGCEVFAVPASMLAD